MPSGFDEPRTRVTFFLPVKNAAEEKALKAVKQYLEDQKVRRIAPVTGLTFSQSPNAVFSGHYWSKENQKWYREGVVMFIVDYSERREEDEFVSAIDELAVCIVEAYENAGSHQEEIWIIAESVARFLQPPGAGLKISELKLCKLDIIEQTGTIPLKIQGNITNIIDIPRTIPKLRTVVRDANGNEILTQISQLPIRRLAGGSTVPFTIDIACMNSEASDAIVTFTI